MSGPGDPDTIRGSGEAPGSGGVQGSDSNGFDSSGRAERPGLRVCEDGTTGQRAAQIIVDNEALADEILQKLREGEGFAQLARKYLTDQTGPAGGDIGVFKQGDLLPEFEDLIQSLRPALVGQPLKTTQGYHIIKRPF